MSVILPVRWISEDRKCVCNFSASNNWDYGFHSTSVNPPPGVMPPMDEFTMSIWVRLDASGDGGYMFREYPWDTALQELEWVVFGSPSNPTIRVRMESNTGGQQIFYDTDYTSHPNVRDGNWHHVMFSTDGDTNFHMAVDGVLATFVTTTLMGAGSEVGFDQRYSIGSRLDGCFSDFWWDSQYVDLSVAVNLQKFYNSGWVYFGDDGSGPLGTQPEAWYRDGDANFGTNYGKSANDSLILDGAYDGGNCIV